MGHLQGRRRLRNDEESVLPLINVVFLLLIFFMIAGRLTSSDPFEIDPVVSSSDRLPDAAAMRVLIGADGRIALDGADIDAEALTGAVAARLRDAPATMVRLKADGRAEAAAVVAVMERLREAGVPAVKLMTVPEAGHP